MHFLGTNSHAYVQEIRSGVYEVGNILYQARVNIAVDLLVELTDNLPEQLNFLTYDEYEQLRMYFV